MDNLHAEDLEEIVLGSLLIDSSAIDLVSDFLRPEMFHNQKHKSVYEAILALLSEDNPIDIISVTQKLESLGGLKTIGGPYFITQLTSRVGSAANIEYHSRVLQEKWMVREVYNLATEAAKQCLEAGVDIFDLTETLTQNVERLVDIPTNEYSPKQRLKEAREAIYEAKHSPDGLGGISTGYSNLDSFTGGFIGGDLIVMGGLPGTYKTALTLNFCYNAERYGTPALMFQQEMSARQLGMRELSMATHIPAQNLMTGQIDDTQIKQIEMAVGQLEDRKIFIDLTSGITIGRIKSLSKKMKKENNIGLIVIDYLGLMNLEQRKHGTQEAAIDNTVRELKVLAKTLDIPIILLAQFSREAQKEPLRVPTLRYLKGSSAIEAHADRCWLLWNPAYYDKDFVYDYGDGNQVYANGKIAIVHAKNRQGQQGIQWLNVNAPIFKFSEPND